MQATAELDSPVAPRNLLISSLDDVLMVAGRGTAHETHLTSNSTACRASATRVLSRSTAASRATT